MMLNIEVFSPMPSASVTRAVTVKPGLRASERAAKRTLRPRSASDGGRQVSRVSSR